MSSLKEKLACIEQPTKLSPYVEEMRSNCESSEVRNATWYWEYLNELSGAIGEYMLRSIVAVLILFKKEGKSTNKPHDMRHFAYFPSPKKAKFFAKRLAENGYNVIDIWRIRRGRTRVLFNHCTTLSFPDITSHIVFAMKLTAQRGGNYDGWEICAQPELESHKQRDSQVTLLAEAA